MLIDKKKFKLEGKNKRSLVGETRLTLRTP